MPAPLNAAHRTGGSLGTQGSGKGIAIIITARKIGLGKIVGLGHADALPGGGHILPELLHRGMLLQGDADRLVQGEVPARLFPGGLDRPRCQQQRRYQYGRQPGLPKFLPHMPIPKNSAFLWFAS